MNRLFYASVLAVFLSACSNNSGQNTSNSDISSGPLPGTEKYYESYAYVGRARELGNQGFAAILSGDEKSAHARFSESTNALSEDVGQHRNFAAAKAEKKRKLNTAVSAGLMIGMTVLGIRASNNAQTAAQSASITSSFNQGLTSIQQLHAQVENRINFQESSTISKNARYIEGDQWRSVVISDHAIANAVVRVRNNTTNSYCTGFYVQPKVVATSAHCFSSYDSVEVRSQNVRDGKAYLTGNDLTNPVVAQYLDPQYNSASTCHPHDLAFLVVKYPSRSWLPISRKSPRSGEKLMILGYSGDLNEGYFLRLDYGCRANSVRRGKFFRHNCASYGGNSGGPVISVADGIKVKGVHSCGNRDLQRETNSKGAAWIGNSASLYSRVISAHPSAGKSDLF